MAPTPTSALGGKNVLKLGMIGLDTSHAPAFTKLLNDSQDPFHVRGGKVVIAYPGDPSDFHMSYTRKDRFTKELSQQYGVKMTASIEEVAEYSDAILLESVDGRHHLSQFKRIAPYRKPVFIDKPLALSSDAASKIFRLAEQYQVPIMSCSALRYAEGLTRALEKNKDSIIGVDLFGPMPLEPAQPGYFWYGIHLADMLYAIFGKGCKSVTSVNNSMHDVVTAEWVDGRVAVLRGNRAGNQTFGALMHYEQNRQYVSVSPDDKPYYASLLEKIMEMFQTKISPISSEETLELIRFLEAANVSRERSGEVIKLDQLQVKEFERGGL
jgi:predicted dehydrogenase